MKSTEIRNFITCNKSKYLLSHLCLHSRLVPKLKPNFEGSSKDQLCRAQHKRQLWVKLEWGPESTGVGRCLVRLVSANEANSCHLASPPSQVRAPTSHSHAEVLQRGFTGRGYSRECRGSKLGKRHGMGDLGQVKVWASQEGSLRRMGDL